MPKLPKREVHHRQRTQSGVLNENEVAAIKWSLANDETPRSLAVLYGVSLWAIRAIARGDTWAWVEPRKPGVPVMDPEAQASLDRMLEASEASGENILKRLTNEVQAKVDVDTELDNLRKKS